MNARMQEQAGLLADARTNLALLGQVISLELRRAFAYRVEFWVRFLGVLFANVAVAYFLWRAIYQQSGVAVIEGFTFHGMIVYYLLVPLVENITRSSTESGSVSAEIYAGTLTRYLVYPMPFFLYKYASTLASCAVAMVQLVIILGGAWLLLGVPAEMPMTPASLALGLTAAVYASFLNFLIVATIEMVAFWADNTWSLNVMLMFCVRLLGGAMLPLSLFPGAVQRLLAYTPFPYLVSFPIMTIAGRVSPAAWGRGLAVMTVWMLIFGVLARLVWRRGNRQYTGVGV